MSAWPAPPSARHHCLAATMGCARSTGDPWPRATLTGPLVQDEAMAAAWAWAALGDTWGPWVPPPAWRWLVPERCHGAVWWLGGHGSPKGLWGCKGTHGHRDTHGWPWSQGLCRQDGLRHIQQGSGTSPEQSGAGDKPEGCGGLCCPCTWVWLGWHHAATAQLLQVCHWNSRDEVVGLGLCLHRAPQHSLPSQRPSEEAGLSRGLEPGQLTLVAKGQPMTQRVLGSDQRQRKGLAPSWLLLGAWWGPWLLREVMSGTGVWFIFPLSFTG